MVEMSTIEAETGCWTRSLVILAVFGWIIFNVVVLNAAGAWETMGRYGCFDDVRKDVNQCLGRIANATAKLQRGVNVESYFILVKMQSVWLAALMGKKAGVILLSE